MDLSIRVALRASWRADFSGNGCRRRPTPGFCDPASIRLAIAGALENMLTGVELSTAVQHLTKALFLSKPARPPLITTLPWSVRTTPLHCTSTANDTTTGVLDAHSKHFMLAQGSGNMITNFNSKWSVTAVDYAGEIIVRVKPCDYIINQGSGTYRPKAGKTNKTLEHLEDVANTFAGIVPAPAILWKNGTEVEKKYIHATAASGPLKCK